MIIKVKPISAINNQSDINGLGKTSHVFFMSETPISNEIYCEFLNANLNQYKKQYRQYLPEIVYDDIFKPFNKLLSYYPITNISYSDARSFIMWLNTFEKQYRYYMPMLSEWYKAAYYDPISKSYYNFPNRMNDITEISIDPTSKYGINVENVINKKTKNKYFIYNHSSFGIRDMMGNTYEMINNITQDYYTIAGSSWNRNRLNAHKDNYNTRTVHKKYKSDYLGFRVCKIAPKIQLYISLHNEFGDGWKGDYLSVYDTNYGILCNKLTLKDGYNSDYIPFWHYPITDKLIIFEYVGHNKLFYENSIKIYNHNKKMIYEYEFKENNTKKIIDLDYMVSVD